MTITGVFDDEDLVKFYSVFDILVFPSLAEGFGYVMVEGMYMGIPTIVSDLDVLKEVSQNSITYFKTKDPMDLAMKISDTYDRIIKGEDLTSVPKRIIEDNYSMSSFINNYEKLYREFLDK